MTENSSFQALHAYQTGTTAPEQARAHSRVIAITSGKGGVGKTNITTNLGIALASQGAKVCIFDADTSLANINILLGLAPKHTLEHLLLGEKTIDEIALDGPRGVKIIPAASGIAEYADLDKDQRALLLASLEQLENSCDYLLIDTAAGVGENVLSFVESAQYTVVVISPEPTSLTDAFALVKVLKRREFKGPIYVLVNMVANFNNSMEVFNRFQGAVEKYLQAEVSYLGYIALDENLISAVHLQRPVILMEPNAPASRCFHNMAEAIDKNFRGSSAGHSFSAYWAQRAESESAASPPPESDTRQESPDEPRHPENKTIVLPTDETEAEELLKPVIEQFVEQFGRFPFDARKSLYRSIEMQDFPESGVRDLALTLESLYEKRYQRPLRDVEETIVKLMADANGSEARFEELGKVLRASYKRQFEKDLFDFRAEFLKVLRSDSLSETEFHTMIGSIREIYRERFGREYRDEKDELLDDVRTIASRMGEQEARLLNGLSRLSEWFNETVAAREELLDCLQAPGEKGKTPDGRVE